MSEKENKPTQKAIKAHQRGKNDAKRAKKLAEQRRLTNKQITALVTEYASVGDAFHSATKFGLTVPELRNLLDSFGIQDVTSAREVLNKGLLAEITKNAAAEMEGEVAKLKAEDAERQERLEEVTKEDSRDMTEAKEKALQDLQAEAARKNKDDAARLAKLQAAEFEKQLDEDRFTIPDNLVPQFKKTILYGVGAAQRQFGGSRREILSEVRRLIPEIDVDVLAR